jgi:hypothetical protein
MTAVLIALVVLLGLLAAANLLLTLALARRLAEAERKPAASPPPGPRLPRVGADVGTFSVPTAGGVPLTGAGLRSGRTLLIFSLAECGPCAELAVELRHTELPAGLRLIILLAAADDRRGELAAVKYPATAELVFLPADSGLTDQFGVDAFPTLVLVEDGRIAAAGHDIHEILPALAPAPA